MNQPLKLYRYDAHSITIWDSNEPIGVELVLTSYPINKYTPKGYWVCTNTKWVSNSSRKRWAYPTKEEALNSYRIRNTHRIHYLERDLVIAKFAKQALETPELKIQIKEELFGRAI